MPSLNSIEGSRAELEALTGMRILLVEDTWYVARALKRQLEILGMEVDGPVATAAEAERLVRASRPDAVVVDYNLRGGEKADSLIDFLHDQGVPVIIASGYANIPLASEKLAAILYKPFDRAQLLTILSEVRRR
jgi:DNA-binding NtrC family response regulator